MREAQLENLARLVALLVDARAELDPLEARLRLQIGLTIVGGLYRDPVLPDKPSLQANATCDRSWCRQGIWHAGVTVDEMTRRRVAHWRALAMAA